MKTIFIAILTISFFQFYAQDQNFVNNNASLLTLNPSFAGSNGGVRDQFSWRHEGMSTSNQIDYVNNSLDCYFKKIKAGIGLSGSYASFSKGIRTSSSLDFTYAQHLKLKESGWLIVPSVQLSYLSRTMDADWYIPPPGMVVQWPAPINETKHAVDGSAGLLMKYKTDFYGGVSFFHINQPDVGVLGAEPLPMRMNVNTSYSFHFGEKALLQLLAVYSSQQSYNVFQFNATLVANHLIAGLGMRNAEGLNFLLGYRANLVTISAGYDLEYTKLSGSAYGATELHLSYNLRDKEHRKVLTNIEAW